jgi:hypothetical protein
MREISIINMRKALKTLSHFFSRNKFMVSYEMS